MLSNCNDTRGSDNSVLFNQPSCKYFKAFLIIYPRPSLKKTSTKNDFYKIKQECQWFN
jgi:hypothetical protein